MKTLHGTTCRPEGREIDVCSRHPEWTKWAVVTLYRGKEAEALASAVEFFLAGSIDAERLREVLRRYREAK